MDQSCWCLGRAKSGKRLTKKSWAYYGLDGKQLKAKLKKYLGLHWPDRGKHQLR